MTTKVNLPKSGMGIEEGTILRWLLPTGQRVQQGQPMAEVETAKAVQEVVAPVSGVLAQILIAEGETAAVNTPIALIEADDT